MYEDTLTILHIVIRSILLYSGGGGRLKCMLYMGGGKNDGIYLVP